MLSMNTARGFSLIELMVSVAIFTIVMVIALGSLLAISASERKAETLKSVMNNLNFALDSMSRAIRTGANYHCGSSGTLSSPQECATADTYLAVQISNGSVPGCDSTNTCTVIYWLDTTPAHCGQTGAVGGCIMRRVITQLGADSGFLQITSPEVVIATPSGQPGLSFYVKGSPLADGIQPKVVLIVNGYVQINVNQQSYFYLQTAITQRIYDQ